MRAVVFSGSGGAEVMSLEELPDPDPGAGEVLVEAAFAGINPADLNQRAGRYPAPPGVPADIPGLEVCGTVAKTGPNVIGLREGDRIFGIVGGGGLADRVVVHERHVAKVPGRLDDETAAAAPEAFMTAHDAVFSQAALRMGETLLVNGATGGVGSAAVQLGLAGGARVFASARSEDGRRRLAELGAEAIAPEDVAGNVTADVVLELVGSPNLDLDLDVVATKGRIVIVGTGAGAEGELSLRKLMSKRARLIGTVLRARPHEEKGAAVQAFAREVVPLLESGRVQPFVDRVFPAEEAAEAFDYMAQPGKFGKVLLAF